MMSSSASHRRSGSASEPNRTLRAVDLTGRERQLREAMAAMSRIAAHFARAARRTLPFLVLRKSRLVIQPVAISAIPGEPRARSGPTLHAFLDEEGGPAWACVSLNDVSLGLILEGALGAAQSKAMFALGSELTLAQRALAGRLLRALAQDLLSALRKETDIELQLSGVHATPSDPREDLQRPDGLSVECHVEGVAGAAIGIAVQAGALEAAVRESEDEEPSHGDARMHQVIQDVPVEVLAELGRLSLGLRQVLKLEIGQVLRLSTAVDDPIRIDVEGLKKFEGRPVVSRGQLSVEIKGRYGDS